MGVTMTCATPQPCGPNVYTMPVVVFPVVMPTLTVTAVATPPVNVNMGTFQSSGMFTQAALPGIIAGGVLQAFSFTNTGTANVTFTGGDAQPQTVVPGAVMSWQVDDSRDMLTGFTINAAGSTVVVVYTYR